MTQRRRLRAAVGGTPERLIEAAGEGTLELFTSEALLAELAGILGRSKFAAKPRQKNLQTPPHGDALLLAFGSAERSSSED